MSTEPFDFGTIVEHPISEELSTAFMDYAMAVIVSRALPDVRDGLKPVQRRILYTMWEEGLLPSRPYRKSARVVGTAMGKYHPHGDQAIYDAMVRMAQDWSLRLPLVDPQGNFGSADDSPAAMRYCVAGDTIVETVNGPIRIDAIVPFAQPESDNKIDIMVFGRHREPVCASMLFHSGFHETFEVVLDNGFKVTATGNHPLLTVDSNGEELWALVEDLDVGQPIALALPSKDFQRSLVAQLPTSNVASIKTKGIQAVYSIKVDSSDHAFIANGLVNHNTEARLATISNSVVSSLDEGVVDFSPTYDDSGTEPVVLPVRFPNLLVNGASGIAVGMATQMAPHNLTEIANAVYKILDNPKVSLNVLLKDVKGPDFPTGGIVIGSQGLKDAYATGKGQVSMRGVAVVEDVSARRKAIIVNELPYTVGPERFITRVAAAVREKKVEGITGISDHTDRFSGLRIVLTMRSGVNPSAVLAQLYKYTPLEERFAFNNVALVQGVPHTLGLRALLDHYIAFQVEIVTRRARWRLDKATTRVHLVQGLLIALDSIDDVVATIRKSRNTDTARKNLRKLLKVSIEQVNYILEMPLRRLVGLEVRKLKDEQKELLTDIKGFKKLLGSKKAQHVLLREELAEIVALHETPRRTQVISVEDAQTVEILETVEITDAPCNITLSRTGKIARDEGGRRKPSLDDVLITRIETSTTSEVFAVSNKGVAYRFPAFEIPQASGAERGVKASQFCGLSSGETIVGLFSSGDIDAGKIPVLVTKRGVLKRINPKDLSQMKEVSVVSLAGDDEVLFCAAQSENSSIGMLTKTGQMLRTLSGRIRPQGRSAGGVAGIKLSADDEVLAAGVIEDGQKAHVIAVVDSGTVKASLWDDYPTKGRGTAGVRSIRFLKGESHLVGGAIVAGPWTYVNAKGHPLGDSAAVKRDASGTILEGAAHSAGAAR